MEAINACPHHGFDTWLLVSYFYDGISSSMKQLLEMMCERDFMSKNPEEAMDLLSYVAEISKWWDELNARDQWTSCSHPFEETTFTSRPILAMECIRGGHTDPSVSREPGQEPPFLRIYLRPLKPWPFRLLRVRCPLALLTIDTRHGDHQLLHPLIHQYIAFHLRELGPQTLERCLGMHSLSLRPQWILSVLPALLWKPSSRGLWSPHRPLRAIQIVE